MQKLRIKRLYIMPEVWETVTQSQVFNWIELINKKGIITDCLSITTEKLEKNEIKKIENKIGGKFIQIKNFKTLIINDLFLTSILIKYYISNYNNYDKIIFQTRIASIGLTYNFLRFLPKAKFIFEARAATNEEIVHVNKDKEKTLKSRIKNYFSELSEKLVVTKSDKVFCVSNTLKNYYIEKYKMPESRFIVFPGAADRRLFFIDDKNRKRLREDLNVNKDDILVVYSGKLDKKWEIPEKIILFFKRLYQINPRFKLLLLTPDLKIANHLIQNNNLLNVVSVKKAGLSEVNMFLNASDVGLLLREDIPMNNVASPTKFAEYLMAGLPVIISKGVYDFAKDINNTGFGVVVDKPDEISEIEFKYLLRALGIDRKLISKWGIKNFSKESFIRSYVKALNEI